MFCDKFKQQALEIQEKIKEFENGKKTFAIFYNAKNEAEQQFLPFFQIAFTDTKWDIRNNDMSSIDIYDMSIIIEHNNNHNESALFFEKVNEKLAKIIICKFDIDMAFSAKYLY